MLDANEINGEMNTLVVDRRFSDILKKAEELIDDFPESYLGRWWKARAYTFMGDTDAALHWLMEAMKKAEDNDEESKISSSMANIYNIRKDWHQSLNYTEIALELNQENVVAVLARSIALMATGKKREANQLLDRKNEFIKNNYQKACAAAVKKDKNKMLEHLAKAIKENPHSRITVQYDPDFEVFRRDSDFRGLLKA
jgi:tetratricopeptide (TPR) repeat protein